MNNHSFPHKEPALTVSERARIIEAIIFASAEAVPFSRLIPYLDNEEQLPEIIDLIQSRYDERSGVELQVFDRTLAFRTCADVAGFIRQDRPVQKPLSRAALEVLAIIAYHQPITRSEIEEIRGISLSRGTIDILLELEWIKPRGRRRTPGRPLTWGTSAAFLDHFGLSSVDELPGLEELKSAGLLRKGQVLGGLGESLTAGDDLLDGDVNDDEADFFEDEIEPNLSDETEILDPLEE